MSEATPIRKQYLGIKRQYPDAIVLFRLGDFYETFDEDAKTTSRELEIVLTSREMGKGHHVPMAGIPYHALDNYLARLINAGHRVAICEQLTRPGDTRGIVERSVVRLVTPGTLVEPSLLDAKTNNYLVSLVTGDEGVGLAYLDISTGEFATTQMPSERLKPELERLKPSELIVNQSADISDIGFSVTVTPLEDYHFELEVARALMLEHFRVVTLEGYGCAHLPLAISAAGAIIHYLGETQKAVLGQIKQLSTYSTESFMALDAQTQANLEIFRGARSGNIAGSLLGVIDQTRTAMGGRLLKRWLGQPLLDLKELIKRQDATAWFGDNSLGRARIISLLGEVADLERLINRVRSGIAQPGELVSLRRSLEVIPELGEIIENANELSRFRGILRAHNDVVALLGEAIIESPGTLGEGGVIKPGFSEELDNLRQASKNARQYLAGLEKSEREKTGIKNLKVGYNRVFGYYIEVSNPNLSQVPPEYIRKQTLINGERYFTTELKEQESLILNVKERLAELETEVFGRVLNQVSAVAEPILATARAVAELDVISNLAEVAVRNCYIRPKLAEGGALNITGGRHPVVERNIVGGSFVPNDTYLANGDTAIVIITGPNMSGKSTYLRQVALITLLAQIGSFVPAEHAVIGIVDRIFTRIGAREDLSAGQSTFMVEMVETANILNNATARSLLILDEIGRGTSTYDGLAIARSVVEYIHNSPELGAKTLFATHYHEMVSLADFLPRVKNFNVAVVEEGGKVIFLHKIIPGGVDRSYGIHVAQLAGLPKAVINRAREVLDELESESKGSDGKGKRRLAPEPKQLSLLRQEPGHSKLLKEISGLDINSMTPLEAITKLYELQKKAGEEDV